MSAAAGFSAISHHACSFLGALALSMVSFVTQADPGDTELASVHYAPASENNYMRLFDISSDGRYVVFRSASPAFVSNDTNGTPDVFVRDRLGGRTFRANLSTT